MKKCSRCGQDKPPEAYYRDRARSDGLSCQCKACKQVTETAYRSGHRREARDRAKAWRLANPERAAAKVKQWYAANRDRALVQNKRWYAANRARSVAASKEWARANPERRKAIARKWRESNPEEQRRRHHRSKLRRYNLTPEEYENMLVSQSGVCYLCHQPSTNRLAVDHCHKSGKVRALLCGPCNTALARAEAVPEWTLRAAAYLDQHRSEKAS